MPTIPDELPLADLVHQQLTQLCIGGSNVVLHFYKPTSVSVGTGRWEPGASIGIQAGFELKQGNRHVHRANSNALGHNSGPLSQLLGQHVISVEWLDQHELILGFSNDYSLQLLTDASGFESMHINLHDDSFVITSSSVWPF